MRFILSILFAAAVLLSCSRQEKAFRIVPSSSSGITFRNTLEETVDFNIFNYMYFYNGGGVSVGDVNGDDLPDIYFTGNQVPNKLYLNEGGFKFRDVTEVSGVAGYNAWSTGVTMADVNNDGRLDIYVGFLGDYAIYQSRNQLFINEGNNADGVPVFTDKARDFGLDLAGFSTQAAFFDYDRDGDLDMYMLNHSLHQNGTFGRSKLRYERHALAGDKLLRNDGGRFIDVTAESGIYSSVIGYGLGLCAGDINMDGWIDIYVGNDFHENDYLYINQGDGTFREVLEQQMNHTSRYTMGVDMADFNNDAFPDLVTMDMLPADQRILKASAAEDPYDVYNFKINYGYNHQFARNTLQLNNGNGTFSDIALLAGIPATDWSWSALFADLNLDGHKDVFVSNGILRRSNDLDYINFITADSIQRNLERPDERQLSYTGKMPQIKIPNFLFINNGDSTFRNIAADEGLGAESYSNGSAYADLDNDGDLDLVVNNIQDEAFLIENRTITGKSGKEEPGFLKVVLKGKQGNTFGIGTKVFVYSGGRVQLQECMPTRGFQSSVDTRLIFGLGVKGSIDSVKAVWTDGSWAVAKNVQRNSQIVFEQKKAAGKFNYFSLHKKGEMFSASADSTLVKYPHEENNFIEFNRESLIPHMVSAEGPAAATADINNDGIDDFFLGGAKRKAGRIFIGKADGSFQLSSQPSLENDSTYEDVDAVFADVNADTLPDLIVVSGGNEWTGKSTYRRPRLYINDGNAGFSFFDGIPEIFTTGSAVCAADIDGDKDTDLFIGSRAVPWKYGVSPDSYILFNDGQGKFTDVTGEVAPALKEFGLVKDAVFTDMNGDGSPDLVIAAEWAPVSIFLNSGGKLRPIDVFNAGLGESNGWWSSVAAGDLDGDGDTDLVVGNLGLNSRLKATTKEPVLLYVGDFDRNDSIDQVLTHFINGTHYPFYTRDELTRQMPYLKKKYLSYAKFSQASFEDVFERNRTENARRLVANVFQSSIVENLGDGKFALRPLPQAAQMYPLNAILINDFDNDGKPDILTGGNFYPINIQMGRYDAGYGSFLRGDGKGNFRAVPAVQSGFSVKGEVRKMAITNSGGTQQVLLFRNNDTVEKLTILKK